MCCCLQVSTPSCSRGAATSSTDTAPSTEHTATGAPLYSVTTALPQHQSRYSQGSHCPLSLCCAWRLMAARCLQGLQTSALSELHSIIQVRRAGLPRKLRLQQGLVAPRPVQAEGMLLSPMVPARLPSLPTSPQMRKGEGRGRGGRIELTPEHVSFPLCIIVQIHVVLFYILSKIYYSAPNLRSIRFQPLLHH